MWLGLAQRLVRFAPGPARLAWALVPGGLRRRLAPLVYPVAAGDRRGGLVLEVPAALDPRRFDVVVPARLADAARAEATLAELRELGHRVLVVRSAGDLCAVAEAEGVTDGVLLAPDDPTTAGELVACARRMGLAVVPFRAGARARDVLDSTPSATIIVVTYANRELCGACLRAVLRNTPWPRLEVVVVDNGSTDGTRELLEGMAASEPRLVVLRNDRNLGFARATNQGLARATGDVVALLNDDTAVGPAWLSRLAAALGSDPALGLVCPVTNEIGNEAKIPVAYDSFDGMERLALERAWAQAGMRRDAAVIALFCAAARRDVLASVGGLDERYEVGMFEDDDLSRTLGRRGLRLAIVMDAFVHHVGRASFSRLSDAEYLRVWEANRRRFEEKWGEPWRPPRAAPAS